MRIATIVILVKGLCSMADSSSPNDLAGAIRASAERLGINPSDLATAISYETSGSFDPWKKGPTTQWGEHRGLLQWGEPQRQKYGVTQDMSVADQMKAAEQYLLDAGVKPGHGLIDVYSAINAGRVGRYNASDANNGGAPGNVADKVATMAGHRLRANALLGGEAPPVQTAAVASAPASAASAGGAPLSLAPAGLPEGVTPEMLTAMAAIPKIAEQSNAIQAPALTINFPMTPAQARARAMAKAAARSAIA